MDYNSAFFFYTIAAKITDALLVMAVWQACWYLRFSSAMFPVTKGTPSYSEYSALCLPLVVVVSVVFHMLGAYRGDRLHFGFRAVKKTVQALSLSLLVFIAVIYFRGDVSYSRLYLILFLALATPCVIFGRLLLWIVWLLVRDHVIRRVRVLVVGSGDLLQMYLGKLRDYRPYPIEWIGRLGAPMEEGELMHLPYLGQESRLAQVVENKDVDHIVISYSTEQASRYQTILESVSNELVTIKVLPDFGRYNTFAYTANQELGVPLLQFNQTPVGTSDRAIKRLLDLVGSVLFLILFSPLYLMIALLIKITSRGPVFYSQERMGADGRVFTLYKFRSMRTDAEIGTGAVWAVEDDPRVTPIGKILRRTSLDELPQLFNVLLGDMSLVGPRPERPVFVHQFRKDIPKYMLRHKMKSGLTGWAQVNGWRGNTSLEERIKHDLFYIGHWSHFFDLKILCLTMLKGFVNRHAY